MNCRWNTSAIFPPWRIPRSCTTWCISVDAIEHSLVGSSPWPPHPQPPLARDEVDLWWLPSQLFPELSRRPRLDALLRGVLASYSSRPPEQLCFDREAKGRPFLRHANAVDFNLSDTAGGSVIAVCARGRVGIDLEHLHRQPPALRLARRYFDPGEVATLESLDAESQRLAFLRLWTAKESVCKSTGTGIYGWLPRWVFEPVAEQPLLLRAPVEFAPRSRWWFLRVEPAAGFTAVLAFDKGPRRLRRTIQVSAESD